LPLILGALLDLVAKTDIAKGKVTLKEKPRMADFAVWGEAMVRALGFEKGVFMQAYQANQLGGQRYILEDSVLTKPLQRLMEPRSEWNGSASLLLQDLGFAGGADVDKKLWPKKASVLGNMLRRIQPLLPLIGLTVEFDRTSDERCITILNTGAKLPS
jgi:hypothetical protein